jgi:glucose/arabinose dehydrogenase
MSRLRHLVAVLPLLLLSSAFTQTFNDPGFVSETVVATGTSPMGVAWANDGRTFVWRKPGYVMVFDKGSTTAKTFLDIHTRVNSAGDRGLVGFALDPDFDTNGFFYISYVFEPNGATGDTGPKTERVSRFSVKSTDPTVADPASETVILGKVSTVGCSGINQDCIPDDRAEHTIDDLHFYNGALYVSVGDGASDENNTNTFRVQNLDTLNGKLLRIHTDGTGFTDNPFYNGSVTSNRSKVLDYGLRNPFRFSIDESTGKIYIGDVGQSSWEEVNTGVGKNFGWPCFEGNGPERVYTSYPQCDGVSSSSVTFPIKTYPHTEGVCVIGGVVYRGSAYPATYQGSYFYADYVSKFMKRLTFDTAGNVTGTQTFATGFDGPVYIKEGPDGNLYYIEIGLQRLKRIRFTGSGNRAPVAHASAQPTSGYAPLNVQFSSAGTSDPDGDTLNYNWDFGDGVTSTSQNPSHQYPTNGKFNVVLTVKDPSNASDTDSLVITVGSTPPTANITTPADGTKADIGQTVNFSGNATDPDDGPLPDSSLTWDIILHHNTHTHLITEVTGSGGSFTVEAHDTAATFYYEVKLTAVDSTGLTGTKSVSVFPNITTANCPQPTSSTATIICSPADASTVPSPVRVLASGGSSVTNMEVWIDGVKKWQGSGRTVDQSFALADGTHKLSVYGKNGSTVLSNPRLTFTVSPNSTTCTASTATSVNICSPTEGSTINSPFQLVASGGSSVTFMEAWLDGVRILQTQGNRIDQSFPTGTGSHTLTVYGKDAANTTVDTEQVHFTVGSGTTTCAAPSTTGLNVCSPTSTTAPGSTMSSPVRALAAAKVSGTFARMELWVDGVKKLTVTSTPKIDTSVALPSGSHRFSFYAINTAGTKLNKVTYATVP